MRRAESPENRPRDRWKCGLLVNDGEPHGRNDGIGVDEVAPGTCALPTDTSLVLGKAALGLFPLSPALPRPALQSPPSPQPLWLRWPPARGRPSRALPALPASSHVKLDAAGFRGNAASSDQPGYPRALRLVVESEGTLAKQSIKL